MSVIEMKVPNIGESINEVTLSSWIKGNGEYVDLDEPICEFESDKATLEFPAEASGRLTWVAQEGDDLEIGALVAKIDTSVTAPSKEQADDKPVSTSKTNETTSEAPKAEKNAVKGHPSPAAAKILRESEIQENTVQGSGKDGRITKENAVKAAESSKSEKPVEIDLHPVRINPIPQFARTSRTEKMSRMRRTIAKRLVHAKNSTAMLTTFNEIDLNNLINLRKKYQEKFVEKYGIKLGFMSLFAKACSQVLIDMPQVNAILNEETLTYHDYVDISIAISTPTGLVVPPVHNVESLKFHEIEFKIKELADKARAGSLSLDEMKGGTFTITNGGIFGSMLSTPIINEPQSAILGMHNIIQRPIAIDGEVVVRPMMYVALSYDHRVIDGSTSVTFLVKVKELLEDPVTLLLDL